MSQGGVSLTTMASSPNWGSTGIGSFVPTTHNSVYPSIDPTLLPLSSGHVVCILGASGAIGAGIAYSYAKAGASKIFLASRRIGTLTRVAEKCKELHSNVNVQVIECDIASNADVQRLTSDIKSAHGMLDSVIVCSGWYVPPRPKCYSHPNLK